MNSPTTMPAKGSTKPKSPVSRSPSKPSTVTPLRRFVNNLRSHYNGQSTDRSASSTMSYPMRLGSPSPDAQPTQVKNPVLVAPTPTPHQATTVANSVSSVNVETVYSFQNPETPAFSQQNTQTPVFQADLSSIRSFTAQDLVSSTPVTLSNLLGKSTPQTEATQPDDAASQTSQSHHSLSSATNFDWDSYLDHKEFATRLLDGVVPFHFRAQTKKVFDLMDNIHSFQDLVLNFECLGPIDIIDLFPSKSAFSDLIALDSTGFCCGCLGSFLTRDR